MLLHARQAAADYDSIIIATYDTDVLILCMVAQARICCSLYVKCDTSTLDIKKMCAVVGQGTCAALLGVHACTGCDRVSAFSSQGKRNTLKLLLNNTCR